LDNLGRRVGWCGKPSYDFPGGPEPKTLLQLAQVEEFGIPAEVVAAVEALFTPAERAATAAQLQAKGDGFVAEAEGAVAAEQWPEADAAYTQARQLDPQSIVLVLSIESLSDAQIQLLDAVDGEQLCTDRAARILLVMIFLVILYTQLGDAAQRDDMADDAPIETADRSKPSNWIETAGIKWCSGGGDWKGFPQRPLGGDPCPDRATAPSSWPMQRVIAACEQLCEPDAKCLGFTLYPSVAAGGRPANNATKGCFRTGSVVQKPKCGTEPYVGCNATRCLQKYADGDTPTSVSDSDSDSSSECGFCWLLFAGICLLASAAPATAPDGTYRRGRRVTEAREN